MKKYLRHVTLYTLIESKLTILHMGCSKDKYDVHIKFRMSHTSLENISFDFRKKSFFVSVQTIDV